MEKDNYGKKPTVPPLPLSFDRVYEGRFPRSNSLLFKLPFEVLGLILQHVESTSLSSLALVNRDCRQWARSCQFASVQLECGDPCLDLIELLRAEGREKKAISTTMSPSLGVCIRRMKIIPGHAWLGRYKDDMSEDSFRGFEEDLPAAREYYGKYHRDLQQIFTSRQLLPHLEELDLGECQGFFGRSFFNNLTQSSIQHLYLSSVFIKEDFAIGLPDMPQQSWPLRTLHLEIRLDPYDRDVTTAPLSASLLKLCASTLESLTWIDDFSNGAHSFATAGLNSLPCFTRLRNISLRNVSLLDSSMLEAFLQYSPRKLSVGRGFDQKYALFFQDRGTIPSLNWFNLSGFGEHTGSMLRFLTSNTHLSMMSVQEPTPVVFLETQLLPLLSKSFSRLTSLSLFWEATTISESALEMIGSLTSLQQIHLSAGKPSGWEYDFEIDHEVMKKHLQKLTFLKKIAFSRDSYSYEAEWAPLQYYYEIKYFADEDPRDLRERHCIWEQMHRTRMLTEADDYGQLLPQLEWIFFGQIIMGFEKLSDDEKIGDATRSAVALSNQRDTCKTFLKETFGICEEWY